MTDKNTKHSETCACPKCTNHTYDNATTPETCNCPPHSVRFYDVFCQADNRQRIPKAEIPIKEYERLKQLDNNVQKRIAMYEHDAKTYKENGIILARYEAEAIAGLLRRLYG